MRDTRSRRGRRSILAVWRTTAWSTGKCLSRLLCQVTEYFLSCEFDRLANRTSNGTLVHLCLPVSHFTRFARIFLIWYKLTFPLVICFAHSFHSLSPFHLLFGVKESEWLTSERGREKDTITKYRVRYKCFTRRPQPQEEVEKEKKESRQGIMQMLYALCLAGQSSKLLSTLLLARAACECVCVCACIRFHGTEKKSQWVRGVKKWNQIHMASCPDTPRVKRVWFMHPWCNRL